MKDNPLLILESLGQSVWVDFLWRGPSYSNLLSKLILEDGVSGVTSNPSIFEKAITDRDDYENSIIALAQKGLTSSEIYQRLTVEDIQHVAELLRPSYDRTDGADGYVSLEVSPLLAFDTSRTILDARRLWSLVDRPNTMIKVPATAEGIPAIRQLIGEGINVNITLLFGLSRYKEVLEAYLSGLEAFAAQGGHLKQVASVASFFLSRIDVLLDPKFEKEMSGQDAGALTAAKLHGQVAIASAKRAYQIYKEIFSGDRFQKLARKGARTQRLLWASTSTKNPADIKTKYIEPLIGPETITTLPLETLTAYKDLGNPEKSLDQDVSMADHTLSELSGLGFNLDDISRELEQQGVAKFTAAFDRLLGSIENQKVRKSTELQIS